MAIARLAFIYYNWKLEKSIHNSFHLVLAETTRSAVEQYIFNPLEVFITFLECAKVKSKISTALGDAI